MQKKGDGQNKVPVPQFSLQDSTVSVALVIGTLQSLLKFYLPFLRQMDQLPWAVQADWSAGFIMIHRSSVEKDDWLGVGHDSIVVHGALDLIFFLEVSPRAIEVNGHCTMTEKPNLQASSSFHKCLPGLLQSDRIIAVVGIRAVCYHESSVYHLPAQHAQLLSCYIGRLRCRTGRTGETRHIFAIV